MQSSLPLLCLASFVISLAFGVLARRAFVPADQNSTTSNSPNDKADAGVEEPKVQSIALPAAETATTAAPAGMGGGRASDEEEEDSEEYEDEGSWEDIGAAPKEEHKLVLVIRTDIPLSKSQVAGACAHATLASYDSLSNRPEGPATLKAWEKYGQAKITLKCNSEEEMLTLFSTAQSINLTAVIVSEGAGGHDVSSSFSGVTTSRVRLVLAVGPGEDYACSI
ncbi:hypothetical protein HDU93_008231 [Gonapodya sp. JEL0774]|nr:hypothetical protein HDU93_008231 [Gonapodya sp. JEL0774]